MSTRLDAQPNRTQNLAVGLHHGPHCRERGDTLIFALPILVPAMALSTRRLRDAP